MIRAGLVSAYPFSFCLFGTMWSTTIDETLFRASESSFACRTTLYPMRGTPMVSSNSPSVAAKTFAPSSPTTSAAARRALSTVTGFVFPGMILLPATSS